MNELKPKTPQWIAKVMDRFKVSEEDEIAKRIAREHRMLSQETCFFVIGFIVGLIIFLLFKYFE